MAQEEKFEEAKRLYETANADQRYVLESLFPELAESEGERIIKAIKSAVLQLTDIYLQEKYGLKQSDCIAWLEKQGEHANFRNKIQINDKVTRNEDGVLVNLSQLKRVAKKDEKQGEQKDILEDAILDSNEDGLIAETIRYKNEKKPTEWSEEDERFLNVATNILNASKVYTKSPDKYEDTINWLKSLRPNHWKPSDEQMDALHYVTNFDYGGHKATLVSLYEQLKKLREK